jgi:hypothetical protein
VLVAPVFDFSTFVLDSKNNNNNVQGDSVYDHIIPLSIAYRPLQQKPPDDAVQPQSPSKADVDPPGKFVLYAAEGICFDYLFF